MKPIILLIFIFCFKQMNAQEKSETLQPLFFGNIKPTGWIETQMQNDINGFVGNLDNLVPSLFNQAIYSSDRLQKHSKTFDLGNLKSGDAEGDDQYKWWNSETQSNWWDGFIRNTLLLNDLQGIEKVKNYISQIIKTQDQDGYLGIYDKELRYNFNSENGELWAKTTLLRGLLAYYEYSKDETILASIKKAVENVMQNYPINASSPFNSGTGFNGGVSHGLTFTDILDRMYFHTKNPNYLEYATFLYNDYSKTYQSECDAQLPNIFNPNYKLKSHGVHTFEHLRPIIVANYFSDDVVLKNALDIYLSRIENATTITGGAIGDEWIAGRTADATNTGYEYCSLQELLDSYALLFQKSGNAKYGDAIENIFFNAAQGARNPKHSCIAYLKTDNSFEMNGTKNGEIEPDRKQTRYKYSPAHQDVAVCCSPNAGRITPYFVQNSWMKKDENTLVATLLLPNSVTTTVNNTNIIIENKTEYPYNNTFKFKIQLKNPTSFNLMIRKPNWVMNIVTNEKYIIENDFIIIQRNFKQNDEVIIKFETEVKINTDKNNQNYFSYGALVYALPIESNEIKGKIYKEGFEDYNYIAISNHTYCFLENQKVSFRNGKIQTTLYNKNTQKKEKIALIPLGKTILRQVTF